jgi:transposase-like protein
VRLFLEERMTYHAIAKRLGIRKAERIEAWVRAYRREGELGLHKSKGRLRKKQDQAAYIARLEMENALLKNSTGSYANSQNRSPLPSDLLSSREICGAGNEHIF